MEFLQTLAELATEKIQLSIAITIEKGIAVVTVTPKVVNATWTPFVMRGTPEELDAEFEKNVETFKEALGVIGNSETYLEQIKAEAAKKTASKTTTPAKKEEPKKVEPKKVEPKKEEKKVETKKEEVKPKDEKKEEGLEIF